MITTGFFDEYHDEGGGAYVGEDEKAELIDNGTTFPITALTVEDSPFGDGERYQATVTLTDEDGDEVEKFITFPIGTVPSRDRMLEKMTEWLDDPANDVPIVSLARVGRSIIIRNAEGGSDAKPAAKPARKAAPRKTAAKAAPKRATAKASTTKRAPARTRSRSK